jgi:heme exporter protein D
MSDYDSTWMLANVVTLTALLGLVAVLAWRRRGVVSGLRWVGVALLPLSLHLIGLTEALWTIVAELGDFFAGLVWRPSVWLGLILTAVALVLIVIPARLRRAATGADSDDSRRADRSSSGTRGSRSSKPVEDDDLAEIEAILKRRGIQ